DTGDLLDLLDQRLVDEVAERAAELVVVEEFLAPDLGVDTLSDVGEQIVEDLPDGAVQHEGAGHEGDTEDDGDAGGYEAPLVRPERTEDGSKHACYSPRVFM